MNSKLRKWLVALSSVAVVLAVVAVAGCSSNKASSDSSASSSQPAPAPAVPSSEAAPEMAADMVMPAGTVAGIWTQIGAEQDKLSAAIQNGQLKDVHHLAFGIRDLVVALTDKAKSTSPSSASKLDGMVAQVRASADKLDELGDAGDLSGTQAEYAKLQTLLGSIKAVTEMK